MSRVRVDGHFLQCSEELLALTEEEAIGGEAFDGGYGTAKLIGQRTDDGHMGQFGIDEFTGNGENETRLNEAGRLEWRVSEEVGECETGI